MKMKKKLILMIPAMALLASCGGDATVDNTALDAKVNALLDKTKSDLKTNCDAMVIQTAQMRADSLSAVKNAKANAEVPVTDETTEASNVEKPIDPVVTTDGASEKAKSLINIEKSKEVIKTEVNKAKDLIEKNKSAKDVTEKIKKSKEEFNKNIKATKKQLKEKEEKVKSLFK
jgi:hypothetical protein